MSAWFLVIAGILGGSPQAAVIDIMATQEECVKRIKDVELNDKVVAAGIQCVKVVPTKGKPI